MTAGAAEATAVCESLAGSPSGVTFRLLNFKAAVVRENAENKWFNARNLNMLRIAFPFVNRLAVADESHGIFSDDERNAPRLVFLPYHTVMGQRAV